jgi:RNA polymerase sigma-70 factor (ECF subfamily)
MIGLAERGSVDAIEKGTGRWEDSSNPTPRLAEERLYLLYRLHGGPLFGFVLRQTLGDSRQAEDVVQETFVRAWCHMLRHPVDLEWFRPWLYTVARRLVIDNLRTRKARPSEVLLTDLARLPASEDPIELLLVRQSVRHALRALSPQHRAVLIDLYYRGLSYAEVADRQGIPVGTVRSRTHYALRALRAHITV